MTSIAAWGKLPGIGDFLRIGSEAGPVAAYDAAFTALRLDAAGAEAFAVGGPVVSFVHHADRWWGAVVLPSTDRVGRHAPFVAVAGIKSVDPADEIGVLPLAFAPFIQRVLQQHAAGWPIDSEAIRQLLAGFGADLGMDRAEEDFVAHLEATTHEALAATIGGTAVLSEVLRTVMGAASGRIAGSGIRVSPVAGPVQAGFWLSAAWLMRRRDEAPGPLVLHPGGVGRAPSITQLWPGPTASDLAAALWPAHAQPEIAGKIISAPCRVPGVVPDDLRLPADLLTDPRAHLRDLLYCVVSQRRTQRHTRSH